MVAQLLALVEYRLLDGQRRPIYRDDGELRCYEDLPILQYRRPSDLGLRT